MGVKYRQQKEESNMKPNGKNAMSNKQSETRTKLKKGEN